MLDLVIRGGRVVTPSGVGDWDVGVQGERIAALGAPGTLDAGRVIDATGKVVVPGGIDPHTHLAHAIMSHPDEPGLTLGPEEDTRGMLFGGTTHARERCAPAGGIMPAHGEDEDIVQFMYENPRAEGRMDGSNLHLVHNKLSELLAFRRTIALARHTGCAIYFVHTSAREGVEAIREARGAGQPVYGETLHQYACFNAEYYKTPRGFCSHTYPSLKFPEDQQALWSGLLGDGLSALATDEYPTSLALKLRGKTIEDVTGGNLGAEARMGIAWTEGVVKRGMSLARLVDITSANAARIFGLYPAKGALAVGSDADIVLIDPSLRKALARDDFHVSDYSPWEGWQIEGWPVTTLLRGRVMVENRRLVTDERAGRLVPRKIESAVLARPVC